jgi:hypothetical protein
MKMPADIIRKCTWDSLMCDKRLAETNKCKATKLIVGAAYGRIDAVSEIEPSVENMARANEARFMALDYFFRHNLYWNY